VIAVPLEWLLVSETVESRDTLFRDGGRLEGQHDTWARRSRRLLKRLPGDEDYSAIHGYTEVFGVWARPIHGLRLNFNQEYTSFDNVIVRISPCKQSQYRFQAGYTPRPWAVLIGSINIFQQSNGESSTNYQGRNRNYGLTASLAPNERFALDLAYNYNDVMQNALICFNDTPPGVSLPFVNYAASCAANDPSNPLLANSYYTNHTNFGMFTVRFKPIKRLTSNLGGSITNVDGTTRSSTSCNRSALCSTCGWRIDTEAVKRLDSRNALR
jgi:hypothetical protein